MTTKRVEALDVQIRTCTTRQMAVPVCLSGLVSTHLSFTSTIAALSQITGLSIMENRFQSLLPWKRKHHQLPAATDRGLGGINDTLAISSSPASTPTNVHPVGCEVFFEGVAPIAAE